MPPRSEIDRRSPITIRRSLTEQLKHLIEAAASRRKRCQHPELAGLGITSDTVAAW